MSELSMSVGCMPFNSGHLSHDSLIEGKSDIGSIRPRFAPAARFYPMKAFRGIMMDSLTGVRAKFLNNLAMVLEAGEGHYSSIVGHPKRCNCGC